MMILIMLATKTSRKNDSEKLKLASSLYDFNARGSLSKKFLSSKLEQYMLVSFNNIVR